MKISQLALHIPDRYQKLFRIIWLLGLIQVMPAHAVPNSNDQLTIEYLIHYVGNSEMIFVRNFGKHNAKSAADHIRKKYDHFLDEIDSPEVFIELCASKSLITGQAYKVIDPHGKTSKTQDWLLDVLNDYRKNSSKRVES